MARIPDESKPIELVIPTDDDPQAILILRTPSDRDADAFQRNVVKTIHKRHNKEETVLDYDLMKSFIDKHLTGCQDIEVLVDGEYVALDPAKHENWKERIPVKWKYAAATYFTSGDAATLKSAAEKK